MSSHPEERRPLALRILTDTTSAAILAGGGFLASAGVLIALGWRQRPDLEPGYALAIGTATSLASALSPVGLAFTGLALLLAGGLAFLLNKPHNLRWLAISLACLSVVGVDAGPTWLDVAILIGCALGWSSQYLPKRESAAT